MIYIKVAATAGSPKQLSLFQKIVRLSLGLVLPQANPDFDKRIHEVATWLIEFEDENAVPEREIGLDNSGQIIVKMPDKRNYGYWTDNNLTARDFQQIFPTEFISRDYFEDKWNTEL